MDVPTSSKKNDVFLTLPETNSSPMKIPMFPGKFHQNGGFSMAMFVLGRVHFHFFTEFQFLKHGPISQFRLSAVFSADSLNLTTRPLGIPAARDLGEATLPETNVLAPENRPKPNRKVVFQPSICRGELLVLGRVFLKKPGTN